eukprot:gene7180-14628_t
MNDYLKLFTKGSKKKKAIQDKKEEWRLTKDGKVYRKGTKKYPNKDIYEGEFVDNLRHGKGTLISYKGNKYKGEFENNWFHGFGEQSWAPFEQDFKIVHGKRYEGTFQAGKRHGKGIFILGTGETYSGMFENNLYHGQGILKNIHGDIFIGEFARGLPCGKQEVTYANGDKYSGEMVSGKYQGKGQFIWSNGQGSYDGDWRNNLPHGRGNRVFSNGNRYVGSYDLGEINGEGLMLFSNGDQYVGDWKRGLFDGKGSITYRHGERYEGLFKNGYRFGEGKYVYTDGGYYEGEYYTTRANVANGRDFPAPDGLRNGYGIRVWSTGSRLLKSPIIIGILRRAEGGEYRGQFQWGTRHGLGIEQLGNIAGNKFTCALSGTHNGEQYCMYSGQWSFGKFNGLGTFSCCNGRSYSGQWKDGHKHGKGIMKYLRHREAGDPRHMFMGGVDSMYRPCEYEGILRYLNGDEIEGEFLNGFLEGLALYRFRGSLERSHYAYFSQGKRLEWTDDSLSDAGELILALKSLKIVKK